METSPTSKESVTENEAEKYLRYQESNPGPQSALVEHSTTAKIIQHQKRHRSIKGSKFDRKANIPRERREENWEECVIVVKNWCERSWPCLICLVPTTTRWKPPLQVKQCHAMQRQSKGKGLCTSKQASKHQCQHGHFGPLVMKPFRAEKCNGSSSSSGGITDDFSACQHVRVTQSWKEKKNLTELWNGRDKTRRSWAKMTPTEKLLYFFWQNLISLGCFAEKN